MSDSEMTPLRADRSGTPSPTDEMLRYSDRRWPWVMLGVFIGVMVTVLQTGDVGTCSPGLALIIGFLPGVLAGIAGTKFWVGGDASAIFANADKLRRQWLTPVGRGFQPSSVGELQSP